MERTQQRNHLRAKAATRTLLYYTKRNLALILLALLFLAGILFGTLLLRSSEEEVRGLLLQLVSGYVEKRAAQPLHENFFSAATSSLTFVLVLFVSGFCAIAQPVELLLPLFRGLGYGFSIGSLYMRYGSRAMGYIALYLLPGMLLSSLAILFCCMESLRLSSGFFKTIGGPEERRREGYPIRIYLARFLVAVLLCLFAALLEAALYALFAGSVHLG